MAERRAIRGDESYAVACPNCNALLLVSNRHIFFEYPPYPARATDMVLTEDGEILHHCNIAQGSESAIHSR